MGVLTAAVVQAGTIGGNTAGTVEKAEELIAECGRRGAQLIVFPEAFLGGYPKGASFDICIGTRTPEGREEFRSYWEGAIAIPGPETLAISRAAKSAHAFVVMGVIERDGGTLYCSVLFFAPDGEILGKHRKTMPTAAERLCWGYGDGSTLTVVDTPWGKLGSVICWENYMPLLRMSMYGKGVALYCAPTADDRETWIATMRHIALEGRCFVLSACQYLMRESFPSTMKNRISDEPGNVLMSGGSVIVNPLGKVLAGPDRSGEAILTADLDLDDIAKGKFDFDVVGHYARPDLFQLTVNEAPLKAVRVIGSGERSD